METKKLEKVSKRSVDNELFGVRKAVGALKELCRCHTGGQLYDVVTERIEAEFVAAESTMANIFNGLVDRVNEARARLAGADVNMNAVEGQSSYSTGSSAPVEIRDFGISRIGQSDVWCLRLNGEEVDGAVMKEADAQLVMDAVMEWRNRKIAERDARQKQESEAGK